MIVFQSGTTRGGRALISDIQVVDAGEVPVAEEQRKIVPIQKTIESMRSSNLLLTESSKFYFNENNVQPEYYQ